MFFKKKFFKKDKKEIPEYLWQKCKKCNEILHTTQLQKTLWVCPSCGYHFQISARTYITFLLDGGVYEREIAPNLTSKDPIGFPGYTEKLKESKEKTRAKDAAMSVVGKLESIPVVLFLTDFKFMGGSMGSVVGEKFYRSCETSVRERRPLIAITSSGGGARMQEGIFSLMQMVKTTNGVHLLHQHKIPYITLLCHPTMAGVMASFAALGDVSLTEPGALLGFTGPRVIQQTIGEKLPEGFQSAEFQLKHGMVDQVIDRRELRSTLLRIIKFLWSYS